MSKPTARDYKRSRRSGVDFERWKQFGIGLAVGLGIATLVFAYQQNTIQKLQRANAESGPQPRAPVEPGATRRAGSAADASDGAASEDPGRQYDFYEMLPKFEVVVPEKEQAVRRDAPNSSIERPGTYVLQVGTYRKLEDAQRVRQQLALQGVDASVQRVAVDNDVWHRVRVGPLTDLAEINRLRGKLRSADLDALVIRLGE